MSEFRILEGDCVEQLRDLDAECVRTCITSPPYYGLRDYGHDGQIGLESSPDEYVERMVHVFREVRRVLTDDGTLWLNIGDSYSSPGGKRNPHEGSAMGISGWGNPCSRASTSYSFDLPKRSDGAKPKDLLGIPWMLAFALRADGWFLRSDIIWHKPNPMPESVRDRPTSSHEHLFLLAKSQRYFYDADAIKEQATHELSGRPTSRFGGIKYGDSEDPKHATKSGERYRFTGSRNKRNVWTVPTQPFAGAHFAVFPPKLVEPCVLAGSQSGDTVLDPFAGSGTTGLVALRHDRAFVGCELNPEYAQIARERITDDAPLLNVEAA